MDENDHAFGSAEKMEAHEKGLLHRAFSVFIFNSQGKMLLQQRALNKYHSPGLWSNACCSHPYPGQDTLLAAERRLRQELGFHTALKKVFDFTYNVSFENGLRENEYDHVFVGEYNGEVKANPKEVKAYLFKSMDEIKIELKRKPHAYTAWFLIAFPKIEEFLKKNPINVP